MKQKIEASKTTSKSLTLADAIKGMHVSDWEIRIHSNGSRKVYARYMPRGLVTPDPHFRGAAGMTYTR